MPDAAQTRVQTEDRNKCTVTVIPGTHGADVVSVDAKGNVYLWDNKVRNSPSGVPNTTIQDTPTFKSDTTAQRNAIDMATADIRASNLPDNLKTIAIDNLRDGNFYGRTVGDGTGARNSALQTFKGGKEQAPGKVTLRPTRIPPPPSTRR